MQRLKIILELSNVLMENKKYTNRKNNCYKGAYGIVKKKKKKKKNKK